MAVPSLRIPLGLDSADFEKGIEKTKTGVRQATQFILKQFAEMNGSLGGPAAASVFAGYGASALRLVGIFGAITAAVKLTGDAIQAARDRIADMVDVANKSQGAGVSAEFWQSFISGAKGAEDKIEELEKALDRAFQATKPILNPDWTVWDEGVVKVSAVEKAMREARELFTTDQNFSGFDLFKNAKDQDQKISAVLAYMLQLKAIGQDVVALDIGEKLFGSQFADNIRTGKTSIESIKRTLDEGSKQNFFSNEAAKNAKELDDRLNDAYFTLKDKFKPSVDDLVAASQGLKGIWASIVESIAAAAGTDMSGVDHSEGLGAQTSGDEFAGLNLNRPAGAGPVPLPRRRPADAPKPPAQTASQRDPFEVSIDNVNKRIAALNAETATIEQGTEARERAKTVALLEEAAKRANTAAGKADIEVTKEQRIEIDKKSDALAKAALAEEKSRVQASINFNRNTGLLSSDDVAIANQLRGIYPDVATALGSVEASAIRANDAMKASAGAIQGNLVTGITDAIDGTKSFGQAVADTSKLVLRSLEEMIVKMLIVAPLMRSLQGAVGGGLGGLFGGPTLNTTPWAFPKFAGGTNYAPGGMAWVGEKGPELVNLPRGSQVIPNAMTRGGGPVTIGGPSIVVNGNMNDAAMSRMQSILLQHEQRLTAIGKGLTSSHRYSLTGVS